MGLIIRHGLWNQSLWVNTPTDDLEAFWKFDGNLNDSKNSNHLTADGSIYYVGGHLPGQSINYNATGKTYTTGTEIIRSFLHNGSYNMDYSFCAWVRLNTGMAGRYIIYAEQTDNANRKAYLSVDNEGLVTYLNQSGTGGSEISSTTFNMDLNKWNYLSITSTPQFSSSQKVYLNGVLKDTIDLEFQGVATEVYIGGYTSVSPSQYSEMYIDNAVYYLKILSTAEILALYNNGVGSI